MSPKKKSGNDKWKIVIVEDSPTQAQQLEYILETHGYQVLSASNGKEAFALLRSDKPNLVISDIVMPEMDGYELCKQIKTDEKLKDVPVILLTVLSDPADVIRGLECGADNFITKPYDERVLFSRIEYLQLNWMMAESKQVQMGVEITFSGQKYFITSDRLQILNLLLSTYEAAVSKSKELEQAQGELRRLNEQLEQRVKARTAALAKANEELKLEITERKRSEHQARERMKELQAFYSLAEITEREGITLDELYQELTNILPKSWRYTENACARIVIGDSEFHTKNFTESAWKQSAPVKVNRSVVGRIDVGYLEQKPEEDEGPFLKEERLLIDTIAERLGHITERKQTEEALGESEERYRTLFESAAQGILIVDTETMKYKYANPAICTMLGYSQEELTKMAVSDIHPKASLEHVLAEFTAQASGEKTLSTLPCLKKDGTIIYANINAAKAIIDGRECNIGFFTDITERKRTQDALKEREERWRSLVENAPNIIMLIDRDRKIQFINNVVAGLDAKDIIGRSIYDYIQPEHHLITKEAVDRVFKTGEPAYY
jgi:PAS domain S-box-containing protein